MRDIAPPAASHEDFCAQLPRAINAHDSERSPASVRRAACPRRGKESCSPSANNQDVAGCWHDLLLPIG